MNWQKYNKAIVAGIVGPVLSAIVAATTDGEITSTEWGMVFTTFVGALAVFLVPNKDSAGQNVLPSER
jgi:uncharacterized membrane protein YeaQ/YmgE (transglycosylase-associated protein family)